MLLGTAPGTVGSLGLGTAPLGPTAVSAYYYVGLYGQSLTTGAFASTVVSSAAPPHKMFNGGVRVLYDAPAPATINSFIPPSAMSSMVTLQEVVNPNGTNSQAETLATGIAVQQSRAMFLSCTGKDASAVTSFVRSPGFQFPNTYAAASVASQLIKASGATFNLAPFVWIQGGTDAAANTSTATWMTACEGIRQDLENCLWLATLQPVGTVQMLTEQNGYQPDPSAFPTTNWGGITVAALQLMRDYPDKWICLGPSYYAQYTASGDTHYSATGYRNRGEKFGQAINSILDGNGWKPCYITNVSRVTTTITVTVWVPVPPLVVDTTLVAAIANSGFTYTGATITGVTITDTGVGDNVGTITITISADAGGSLGYAYLNAPSSSSGPTNGMRGDIRDSDPFVTLYNGYPIPNFLCNDLWVVA